MSSWLPIRILRGVDSDDGGIIHPWGEVREGKLRQVSPVASHVFVVFTSGSHHEFEVLFSELNHDPTHGVRRYKYP